MRTLTRSCIVVLLLSANASPSSTKRGLSSFCPESRHPIDIRFFVDNKNYLAMNYLEITVKQDYFTKRIVKVHPSDEGLLAEGFLTTTVPDGNITVVTCALVSCPLKEMELLCGEVRFPAQIAIDRIHEVTYSTDEACEKSVAPDLFVKQPFSPR